MLHCVCPAETDRKTAQTQKFKVCNRTRLAFSERAGHPVEKEVKWLFVKVFCYIAFLSAYVEDTLSFYLCSFFWLVIN